MAINKNKKIDFLRMLNVRLQKHYVLFMIMICLNTQVIAQKGDTLAILREFIRVSTGYKQVPLYAAIDMRSSSNVATPEEDSTLVRGEFYLQNSCSYVRFGEFEQLINDSTALVVSDKLKQMVLYSEATQSINKAKNMLGAPLPDSSVGGMAIRYSAVEKEGDSEREILLKSRAVLKATDLSRETIRLVYNKTNRLPSRVVTTSRALWKLDSQQYESLKQQKKYENALMVIDNAYFLVKEQVIEYIYRAIQNDPALVKIPALVSDRVVRDRDGTYRPVDRYGSYRLIQH